jgi:hypothetical protein
MERSGTLVSQTGSSSRFRWWVDTSRDLCDVDALVAETAEAWILRMRIVGL